ncbi:IS21 family transposase [Dokdonella sp.]|uniref:IS21 family transposase n=1 Tax=Dokdonella sp. TaxID=2291710 RepID=UPI0031C7BCA5|nr:IS21 family transposase [Dokdonella sp.]
MIDYATYCKIHEAHRQGLKIVQIARTLQLHTETVSTWLRRPNFQQRQPVVRPSRLDPYKGLIVRWLDAHPLSSQQVFQRLREAGYGGGLSILKAYVRQIRPPPQRAFLKLSFASGEAAQVDWGEYGTIAVGNTRRRLSFFVMVLCYSRQMYVEFTVAQTMEHFLACHAHAFAALGVPERIIVDNLKSAVLKRLVGEAPVFNPRYLDFSRHHGFQITACNVRAGWEKGRVESGVGYVKKNFLNGAEFIDFAAVNPAAQLWLSEIANVRLHGETHQRPVDLFAQERPRLKTPNANPYDLARILTPRACRQFRVRLDTNRYSVPAQYAGLRLTLKAYPDRLCIYHQDTLIARHARSYQRRQDIEDPDHPKALLEQRKTAREQRLLCQFLALSNQAQAYYEGLTARRFNARTHLRKILALVDIYGTEPTARAIDDALAFNAFSSEYIAHLLQARARTRTEPVSALLLTRRAELLELDLPEPDLSLYEVPER